MFKFNALNGGQNGSSRKLRRSPPENEGQNGSSSKKLRCSSPDVIVAVGKGANKQEFSCYKVILSFASEVFDTMLSIPMKESTTSRIEFPEKDPEEWKLFYEFIDPNTVTSAKVTKDNVFILVPWFDEFQMASLVTKCDEMLVTDEVFYGLVPSSFTISSESDLDGYLSTKRFIGRKEAFLEILKYYSMCKTYSLQKSKSLVNDAIQSNFKHFDDLEVIKEVIEMLKISKDELLWSVVRCYLPTQLQTEAPTDELMSEGLLSHLIQSEMKFQESETRHKESVTEPSADSSSDSSTDSSSEEEISVGHFRVQARQRGVLRRKNLSFRR